MNNIISAIAQRIRDEHRKHPDIDWEYIAASKIYQSFIDTGISTDTVSDSSHKSDKTPVMTDKIIIDTEVYYDVLKDNALYSKGDKIAFSFYDTNIYKCTMINGSTLYLTEAIIKEMIANREIDTPL